MTYELQEEDVQAIIEAIDRGWVDREYYLSNGNPHIDYGDEWPESARLEAEQWKAAGDACLKLGQARTAASCFCLAERFEASAREYEEDSPAPHNACEDKGAMVDWEALTKSNPVVASIEAEESK